MPQHCRAIVFYQPQADGRPEFTVQNLTIRDIAEDECLVEMVATGLCHTDLAVASRTDSIYPRVLGHEGAGFVRKIGGKVHQSVNLREGDPVLLSIAFCKTCPSCRTGHPSYCYSAYALNFAHPGSGTYHPIAGSEQDTIIPIVGGFFGQSSLGSLAVVKASCIVSLAGFVETRKELQLFAPFGCGFQTGAGTVSNLGKAEPSDSVAIIGLGGVGLAAVMASKIIGCQNIVAIDRIPDRLALAKELGATHLIDNSTLSGSLADAVRDATDGLGTSLTIDTTGVLSIIRQALDMTSILGRMVLLGMSKDSLDIDITKFKLAGKTLLGSVQGDVIPSQYILQMIKWHRAGKFPVERLVRFYNAEEVSAAVEDMKTGKTVKPVILW